MAGDAVRTQFTEFLFEMLHSLRAFNFNEFLNVIPEKQPRLSWMLAGSSPEIEIVINNRASLLPNAFPSSFPGHPRNQKKKQEILSTLSENKNTTWPTKSSRVDCERGNAKWLSNETLCDGLLVQNASKNQLPCNPWLQLISLSDVECRRTTSSPLSSGR